MHRLIEQQFTALREDDRRLLEAGSVSGMVFSAASAAAALGADVSSVADRCARLAFVEPAGTEAWPDGTVAPRFRFRHAMYQEAVYARVPAGRRPQLHDRVGAREEAAWQAQAGERAAVLAMHFERGRDHERAMRYRKLAATVAVQRFADHDAVEHLQRGLESLARVPDSPARAVEEQEFLIALSLALVSTKGHAAPELEPVLARSEVLSRQVDDAVKRFEFLQSMFAFRGVRGEHRRAMAVTDELLAVAERLKDAGMRLAAHRAAAVGALNIGAFASARAHFERALSFYDPERHALPRAIPGSTRNYAVNCHVRLAHVLWILGEDEQATAHADQGVAMARALAHPYGLVEALYERAQLQLARGNRRAALTDADEGFARAREFPRFAALTTFVRGAALGRDGVTAMRDGLAAVQATGTVLGVPRFLSLLAEACPLDEGLRLSQRALALVAKTEERTFESEIHRVHGELLRQSGDVAGAAFMFRRAIEVARAQAARAFERNATASLERLR
jgi:tetratricopeptide (TPR) repeat protein